MRISLKRTCCILICIAVWGNALFASADQYLDTERYFSGKESVSGLISVPGMDVPMYYYAQNDALWENLIYERNGVKKVRPFRDSGCSPSALAIAIHKLVDEEDLPVIGQYAAKPYSLCECSINKSSCARHSGRYLITSQRDYVRFLPLILADFACGNNTFDVYSRSAGQGTSSAYIQKVCETYGLDCTFTNDYNQALTAVGNANQAVIALSGAGGCFTNNGHYIFLACADQENLFVLDPLCRTEYKTNFASKLTILQPGLVSIRHDDIRFAQFSTFVILTNYNNKQ